MLDALVVRATTEWTRWFPDEPIPNLAPMLLAGGPAHRDRVSVLLFPAGGRSPQVIMKVGFTVAEGDFLASEFKAMDQLRPQLPKHLQDSMPRALDLYRTGEATVVAAEVVSGKRLLVPGLTGEVSPTAQRLMDSYFHRSFAFSRSLAEATSSQTSMTSAPLVAITDDFARMFSAGETELDSRVQAFGRSIAETTIEWYPAWQHQDVAVGNVLDDRGHLRFVDWEHASAGYVPWFDVAFAPVVTSHLARRVDRLPSIKSAALAVLGSSTPIGSVLRNRMEEIWDYQIPLPWAVTLAAMEGALRRLDDGREGSPEYAELVAVMLGDDEFEEHVGWLTPRW